MLAAKQQHATKVNKQTEDKQEKKKEIPNPRESQCMSLGKPQQDKTQSNTPRRASSFLPVKQYLFAMIVLVGG